MPVLTVAELHELREKFELTVADRFASGPRFHFNDAPRFIRASEWSAFRWQLEVGVSDDRTRIIALFDHLVDAVRFAPDATFRGEVKLDSEQRREAEALGLLHPHPDLYPDSPSNPQIQHQAQTSAQHQT